MISSSDIVFLMQKIAGRFGYTIKRRRPGIRRAEVPGETRVTVADLLHAVHGQDIYEGFDHLAYPEDLAGWGGDSPAFAELIREKRPKFIIEVGSWKGASAVTIADSMKAEGLSGRILCIDTWLGALEFWSDQTDPERFGALECKHGFPSVYYRFLANVCHREHQQRIVPFPMTSTAAALWLMRTDLRADLIYIDASHEEEDVYQDLIDYHGLLTPGGIIFGDDWGWSGVRAAVERFASEEGLTIRHLHDKWILI
jgi:hypothetical protein